MYFRDFVVVSYNNIEQSILTSVVCFRCMLSSTCKYQTASSTHLHSKHTTTHNRTATADGQMMAQMLSTFTSTELSRFEAYQRASFSAIAVQDWLAACLMHRLLPPNDHTSTITSSSSSSTATTTKQQRPLSDLVVPGSHEDIGVVVATAAKIYAQRLVTAAVQLQQQQQQQHNHQQHQLHQMPLTPQHVWQAYQERQQAGLDPGFYLQANPGLQFGACSQTASAASASSAAAVHERKRLAAWEAQEAYNAEFGALSSSSAANEEVTTAAAAAPATTIAAAGEDEGHSSPMQVDDDKNDKEGTESK